MGTGVEHALGGLLDGGAVFVAEWFASEAGPRVVVVDDGVGDAKDFKEVDPKGLGLAVFVAGVVPSLAEKQCPGFDFVPIKTHLVFTN